MRVNLNSKMLRRGFTLIELLVVIAIIGILSSVVLTSLNQARVKGQHAQTIAEVRQLEAAMTQVADDNGGKPISTGGHLACLGATSCWGGTLSSNAALDTALAKYIKVPAANQNKPSSTNGYFIYRSPGSYYDNNTGITYTGTANSYSIAWVPAMFTPPNQQPATADCTAENATWGTWDNDTTNVHCAVVGGANTGSCRQCGVMIEQ